MSLPTKRPAAIIVIATAVFLTTAKAVDVNGEAQRRDNNAQRVARMSPYMQPKVKAVISDLEHHGHRPAIDGAVWRSPAEQRALVAKGYSTVLYSFHNCSTPAGKPDSLAADITDAPLFWNASKGYWLKLASSAESHDLTTGIYWGLSQANRAKIHTAVARRDWNAPVSLGWDTAHVEPTGITLGQAKKGLRPPIRK